MSKVLKASMTKLLRKQFPKLVQLENYNNRICSLFESLLALVESILSKKAKFMIFKGSKKSPKFQEGKENNDRKDMIESLKLRGLKELILETHNLLKAKKIPQENFKKSSLFLRQSLAYFHPEQEGELEVANSLEEFIFSLFQVEKEKTGVDYLHSDEVIKEDPKDVRDKRRKIGDENVVRISIKRARMKSVTKERLKNRPSGGFMKPKKLEMWTVEEESNEGGDFDSVDSLSIRVLESLRASKNFAVRGMQDQNEIAEVDEEEEESMVIDFTTKNEAKYTATPMRLLEAKEKNDSKKAVTEPGEKLNIEEIHEKYEQMVNDMKRKTPVKPSSAKKPTAYDRKRSKSSIQQTDVTWNLTAASRAQMNKSVIEKEKEKSEVIRLLLSQNVSDIGSREAHGKAKGYSRSMTEEEIKEILKLRQNKIIQDNVEFKQRLDAIEGRLSELTEAKIQELNEKKKMVKQVEVSQEIKQQLEEQRDQSVKERSERQRQRSPPSQKARKMDIMQSEPPKAKQTPCKISVVMKKKPPTIRNSMKLKFLKKKEMYREKIERKSVTVSESNESNSIIFMHKALKDRMNKLHKTPTKPAGKADRRSSLHKPSAQNNEVEVDEDLKVSVGSLTGNHEKENMSSDSEASEEETLSSSTTESEIQITISRQTKTQDQMSFIGMHSVSEFNSKSAIHHEQRDLPTPEYRNIEEKMRSSHEKAPAPVSATSRNSLQQRKTSIPTRKMKLPKVEFQPKSLSLRIPKISNRFRKISESNPTTHQQVYEVFPQYIGNSTPIKVSRPRDRISSSAKRKDSRASKTSQTSKKSEYELYKAQSKDYTLIKIRDHENRKSKSKMTRKLANIYSSEHLSKTAKYRRMMRDDKSPLSKLLKKIKSTPRKISNYTSKNNINNSNNTRMRELFKSTEKEKEKEGDKSVKKMTIKSIHKIKSKSSMQSPRSSFKMLTKEEERERVSIRSIKENLARFRKSIKNMKIKKSDISNTSEHLTKISIKTPIANFITKRKGSLGLNKSSRSRTPNERSAMEVEPTDKSRKSRNSENPKNFKRKNIDAVRKIFKSKRQNVGMTSPTKTALSKKSMTSKKSRLSKKSVITKKRGEYSRLDKDYQDLLRNLKKVRRKSREPKKSSHQGMSNLFTNNSFSVNLVTKKKSYKNSKVSIPKNPKLASRNRDIKQAPCSLTDRRISPGKVQRSRSKRRRNLINMKQDVPQQKRKEPTKSQNESLLKQKEYDLARKKLFSRKSFKERGRFYNKTMRKLKSKKN